jgi:lysylphosphatidylglycerol synthetase-like protein (DUF2156 family)
MALAPEQFCTVNYGQRVFVVGDLDLSLDGAHDTSALDHLTAFLADIDDPAIVVVAGNLFAPGAEGIEACVQGVLRATSGLGDLLRAFCARPGHAIYVLPGAHDHELAHSTRAQTLLSDLGITVATRLRLEVHSLESTDVIVVTPGHTPPPLTLEPSARLLDDPFAAGRFATSRTLYRRFGPALWLGLALVLGADFFNTISHVVSLFTHHYIALHAPHTQSITGNILANLLLVVFVEGLIIAAVGTVARRRFAWRSTERVNLVSEPLANTTIDAVDSLLFTTQQREAGVTGVVVGGSARPALAYLDQGFCATPGPSRVVTTEFEGRLGLPNVFLDVERFCLVEIEAGSRVQVRLIGHERAVSQNTRLEGLVARTPVQGGLPVSDEVIGAWPDAAPFPLTTDRRREAARQRRVRRFAAGLIALDGLLNVIVTTSPPLRSHLHAVLQYLPLGLAQSAAALTALAGVALIMLARGVRRGQRRSWYFAEFFLALTVLAHVARGGPIRSSAIAGGIFAFLLVQRRYFTSYTDRTGVGVALTRLAGIAGTAVVAATIGVEAAARNNVSIELPSWPTLLVACTERLVGFTAIALPDRVSDFVDVVLLTIGISLLVSAIYLLTRPVVDRRLSGSVSPAERRLAELRARDIVRRHGRGTLDYFALRDDKQFYFYRDSLVAYAVYGGVALVSPDPIGPTAERADVFSTFHAFAESRGWTVAVVAASADWTPIYHAAGFHSLYLGDEAIVDCQTFTLQGGKMKGLRQACTRLERHGYRVEFYDPATIDPSLITGVLELVAMLRRGDEERGFSMGLGRLFDPKDKGLLLTIVRGPDGAPAAACQFVPSTAINGFSLDIMRRDPGEHPNGLIDYALCSTIAHLKAQGANGLSLNFAAFRGVLDGERGEGTWTRVERWTLHRLSGVLPIASLWTFNAKYLPRWLPRHLVYPSVETFVPVVSAILRAESLTEIPVLGRFLSNDPTNRPGTVVPPEILAAAHAADEKS